MKICPNNDSLLCWKSQPTLLGFYLLLFAWLEKVKGSNNIALELYRAKPQPRLC